MAGSREQGGLSRSPARCVYSSSHPLRIGSRFLAVRDRESSVGFFLLEDRSLLAILDSRDQIIRVGRQNRRFQAVGHSSVDQRKDLCPIVRYPLAVGER